MKRAAFAVLAVAIVLVSSSTAVARGPKWTLVPNGSSTLDASYCGFPVQIELVVNKEYSKTSTLRDGTVVLHVTGSLKYRLTSPTTTLIENASGPADVFIAPNGSVTIHGRGRGVQAFTAAQSEETGLPREALLIGPTVLRFDPDGGATLLRRPSRVVDLCPQLAG
jgi:hypothetical protein